jgi:hypothetical protein
MFWHKDALQSYGTHFEFFVALKIAMDEIFRKKLLELALEKGMQDEKTKWINNLASIPQPNFFPIQFSSADVDFVQSLENDDTIIIFPSKLAGPDLKWWIFIFAMKTSWTSKGISDVTSGKNAITSDPSQCFLWRDTSKAYAELPLKRKHLHETCTRIVKSRVENERGFVRVRIELPDSPFSKNDENSSLSLYNPHDIRLDLDWKQFSKLLPKDEASVISRNFFVEK